MSTDSSVVEGEQVSGTTFAELNITGTLLQAIEKSGYTIATPIQARAIPPLLEGHDVLGQAQTGTGKTAAFALPMLQRIDVKKNVPQVLVLAPTRELAIQVAEAFERYSSAMPGLRVVPIYGGADYGAQFRALDRGVHVVVGTPGRVMDHIRRESLKLDGLRGLVLDEADEMLNMGFAEDVEWILTQTPPERQIALFSATMPEAIRRIAQKHLRNPVTVTIQKGASAADTVRQRFVYVPGPQKQVALARILEAEPVDGVIVFVKTKSTTEYLAEYLNSQGHRTGALSSDVPQKQRERIVENLRAGKIDVIVATDVAARGLDVQRISHVINFDFPFDGETYVHRIGRTGRAGRSGDAILFVNTRERHMLQRIERVTRQRIEQMEVPSKRAINQRRIAKFHDRITAGLARPDISTFVSVVEQYRTAHPEVSIEQIAASLAGMSTGDAPLLLTDELKLVEFHEPRRDRDESRNGRTRFSERSFDRDRAGRDGDRRRERDERGPRERRPAGRMETFRVEVGYAHQIKPGNIVGAIANETGVESSVIGRIEIFQDYSTVDMLEGMPPDLFHAIKQVMVAGRPLNISRMNDGPGRENRPAKKKFASDAPAASVVAPPQNSPVDEAAKAKKKAKKLKKKKAVAADVEVAVAEAV